jgi:hypothetical protein
MRAAQKICAENYCERFAISRTELFFHRSIFPIDSRAGSCYNRSDSAKKSLGAGARNFSTILEVCQEKKFAE